MNPRDTARSANSLSRSYERYFGPRIPPKTSMEREILLAQVSGRNFYDLAQLNLRALSDPDDTEEPWRRLENVTYWREQSARASSEAIALLIELIGGKP